jgi:hypothetical protein
LWTRLDLSSSSGVRVRVTDAVLAGAAAKARGQLAALDVSGCDDVNFIALLAVVRANAGALHELRAGARESGTRRILSSGDIAHLSLTAPQLTAFHAHTVGWSNVADARRMLRNEPPFAPLRLRTVHIDAAGFGGDADDVVALAADVAAHASLRRVRLWRAPLAAAVALDAVVDAALARQLVSLHISSCGLSPASAPALARLLGGSALTDLIILQQEPWLEAHAATLLGDALRANATLTTLRLSLSVLVFPTLPAALVGHRSVRSLCFCFNGDAPGLQAALGAALGALVVANAPALRELLLPYCSLGDAGLRPLLSALPANTHLRALDVTRNHMSQAFTRDVLLPAVRANTSVRRLVAYDALGDPQHNAFTREAVALTQARSAAAAAAAAE